MVNLEIAPIVKAKMSLSAIPKVLETLSRMDCAELMRKQIIH